MKLRILVFAYILIIYATLPIMGSIVSTAERVLGQKIFNFVINFSIFIIFSLICYHLYRKAGFKLLWYMFLISLPLLFIVVSLGKPAERIHVVEYSILGFLIFKGYGIGNSNGLIVSSVFVSVVGLVDEVIQWILPNRVGDIKDVVINSISGILGVILGKIYSQLN